MTKRAFQHLFEDISFIILLETNTLSPPFIWVTMIDLSISDKKLFSITHAADAVPLSLSYHSLSDRPWITAGLGHTATSLSASNMAVFVCLTS